MRLGFLDFEATGVDPYKASIIEYAFMLYDTELKQPLRIRTDFVWSGVTPSPEITELTGISEAMLKEFGVSFSGLMLSFYTWLKQADYIVAYNGIEYDKPLLEAECERNKIPLPELKWIDPLYDLPFAKHIRERKLTHLATAHEFLNPMPHRALADVITLQKIVSKYDLKSILTINSTPLILVRADVSFNNKDLARNRGYFWSPEKKIWTKKMREFYLEAEIRDAGFRVIVLDSKS